MHISNLNRWERRTFGYMVFDTPDSNPGPMPTPATNEAVTPPPTAPQPPTITPELTAHFNKLLDQDRANRTPAPAPEAESLNKLLKHLGVKSVDEALKPKKNEAPSNAFTQADLDRVKAETELPWSEKYKALETTHTGLLSALAEREIESAAIDAKILKDARKDVATLLKNNVRWNADAQAFQVVNPDGSPRLNFQTAKPMTVAELVIEYGSSRPHLVEGSNTSGGGSGSTKTTPEGKTIYTRDQLKNGTFYEANREDILKAVAEGRIR
jgi:hypothetical protein